MIISYPKKFQFLLCLAVSFVTVTVNAEKVRAVNPDVVRKIPKGLAEDFTKYGPFAVEPDLRNRVRFWIDVYTKYHTWYRVLHDTKYPNIVYAVIDMRNVIENSKFSKWQKRGKINGAVRAKKREILAALRELDARSSELELGTFIPSALQKRIIRKYKPVRGVDKYKEAGIRKRIRTQSGLRENFVEGMYESGRYIPGMRKIVKSMGLPTEIVYLPFLESGFDKKALSKVGASGIWQFIPSTGKFFLRVDEAVDERNDPMKAAEGAALLMKQNYSSLKHWPLAITAYNHGRSGMLRAVRSVKSNSLAEIIASYNGPNFGFASANFYSAFMAALHVAKNGKFYFGNVELAAPLSFEEFIMPEYMDLTVLTQHVGIDLEVMSDYNPGLTPAVYAGDKYIPVGYTLRIPIERRDDFFIRYKTIPAKFRYKMQKQKGSNLASEKSTSKK